MRRYWLAIIVLAIGVVLWQFNRSAAKNGESAEPETNDTPLRLTTTLDKVSYGIGLGFGKELHGTQMGLKTDLVLRGVRDGMTAAKPLLSREQIGAAMAEFQQEQLAAQAELAKTNREAGRKFLEENAKKEGVVTLPSGLQYQVIKQGDGPSPTPDQYARVHYRGTLLDGKVFDSTEEAPGPALVPLNRVISGWQEALTQMKVGDKWRIFVPADLGYGDQGAGGDIPPGATLIFEIELFGVESPGARQPME